MNLKPIGLIVAISIIGVALASFLLSDGPGATKSADSIDAVEREEPSSDDDTHPNVNVASLPTMKTESDASPPDRKDAQSEPDSGYDEAQNENPENKNLEEYFIRGSSLDTIRLTPKLKDNDTFNELMAQLRSETSPIAAEKRMSYELVFYSQPSAQSGTVTVDALECGARLCVSELRAESQPTIDQFVTSLTQSSDLETRAFIEVYAKPDAASGYSETRRIIFSHDPTIESVLLPPEALKPQN